MNNSNLPGGWRAVFDTSSKHTYYVDKVTQETTWTKPTAPTASYLKAKANENVAPPNFFIARKLRQYGQPIGEHSEKGIALHNEWRRKHGMPTWQEEYNAKQAAESAKENAEEEIILQKRIQAARDRSTKSITNVITNTISTYLKGKLRLDEIADILATLDKQGINKNTPNYSKYAKQYLELNKVLYIIKDKFNKYVEIGRSEEYNGKYIGGYSSTNLLKALYLAELSVSLKDEKYEMPVNMEDFSWQGIDEEEKEKIQDYKKYKHTDFEMIKIISRYMGYQQLMDIFMVRFEKEENASHSEDFNMLFPQFMETKARAEAIEGGFVAESDYIHILDKIYEVEFSDGLSNVLNRIKEAEEAAIKEAKKSIVKPLGPEVRENQNNAFGGTRRRRRNRKSTRRNRKSTRRNRRN